MGDNFHFSYVNMLIVHMLIKQHVVWPNELVGSCSLTWKHLDLRPMSLFSTMLEIFELLIWILTKKKTKKNPKSEINMTSKVNFQEKKGYT